MALEIERHEGSLGRGRLVGDVCRQRCVRGLDVIGEFRVPWY